MQRPVGALRAGAFQQGDGIAASPAGRSFARRVRASNKRQPALLVAITGYSQGADRERVLHAGFADHLVKPVDIKQVTTIIDDRLRR